MLGFENIMVLQKGEIKIITFNVFFIFEHDKYLPTMIPTTKETGFVIKNCGHEEHLI